MLADLFAVYPLSVDGLTGGSEKITRFTIMEEVTFMNAIIFDVDGTLLGLLSVVANAWNTVLTDTKN